MHNVVRLSLYPLHHGGLCKNYSHSPEIISCSMQTDNNESGIRVYNGRWFCYIVAHFRGSNEVGDLLTRQARNCIYRFQTVNIILYFVVLADCVLNPKLQAPHKEPFANSVESEQPPQHAFHCTLCFTKFCI